MVRLRYLFLTILLTISVLILTHIPQEQIGVDMTKFGLDKVLHVGAYAIISLFAFLAVNPGKTFSRWIVILLMLFVLAGFDEFTQPYFGRTSSVYDFLADGIGIITVFLNLLYYRQSQPLDLEA